MNKNHLLELESFGQSIWLDYLRRNALENGEFKQWIEEDGAGGLTSNPSIFEKAIAGSHDYDNAIRALALEDKSVEEIYQALTIEDIQRAADLFRPTYDRLRETLFNVLASAGKLGGAIFVDLFAGTGSIGIEALSRGAAQVYFVESGKKAARVIRANLQSLGITEFADVYERPAADALRLIAESEVHPDVIFLDPPYKLQGAYAQVLRIVAQTGIISEAGIVVAEHEKRFNPGEGEGRLRRYRRLDQGDSSLSFYRMNFTEDAEPSS